MIGTLQIDHITQLGKVTVTLVRLESGELYPPIRITGVCGRTIEEGFIQKARQTVIVSVWGVRSNAALGIFGQYVRYCVSSLKINFDYFIFYFISWNAAKQLMETNRSIIKYLLYK